MEEYKIIEEWKGRLPIKIICQAMTGLDPKTVTEKFQQGNIRFREEGKKIINELLLLKTHLPKGVRALTAAIKFLYKMHAGKEPFSIDTMLSKIPRAGIVFHIGDKDQDMIANLQNIYME
jgi:hypothetical protein